MTATNIYPKLDGECTIEDTDGDGMPDKYEDMKGFDKNNADDGAEIASSGYTNLEDFLNGVADGTITKDDYETTGIAVATRNNTARTTYYNVAGEQISQPQRGITVVVSENAGVKDVKKVLTK